jgi:hypothetical protein
MENPPVFTVVNYERQRVLFYPLPFPLDPFPLVSSRVSQQPSFYRWLWLGANKPVNKFSIFEDQHGWNTLNLELSGGARVFIDIQLGHAITTIRLGSELFHDWANHAAGSAPGSPAIEQDRPAVAFQHLALKSGIGHCQRFRCTRSFFGVAQIQRRTTLATFCNLFRRIARVDAILGSALATSYDRHHIIP